MWRRRRRSDGERKRNSQTDDLNSERKKKKSFQMKLVDFVTALRSGVKEKVTNDL